MVACSSVQPRPCTLTASATISCSARLLTQQTTPSKQATTSTQLPLDLKTCFVILNSNITWLSVSYITHWNYTSWIFIRLFLRKLLTLLFLFSRQIAKGV